MMPSLDHSYDRPDSVYGKTKINSEIKEQNKGREERKMLARLNSMWSQIGVKRDESMENFREYKKKATKNSNFNIFKDNQTKSRQYGVNRNSI